MTYKKKVTKKTQGSSATSQIASGVAGALLKHFLGGYGTNLAGSEGGPTVTKKVIKKMT